MKLSEPYTIAYETIEKTVNVFLIIKTNTGIIGYGCAAPDKAVTGETPETAMDSFKGIIEAELKDKDPLCFSKLLANIKAKIPDQPSAMAAVDMALYDILGKTANSPLWKILGGFRDCIKTSITIGILTVEETIERANKFARDGFTCLKIKGGVNVESDIERILKIRESVGKSIEIRFDANQGYSVDDSIKFAVGTRSANIQFIEQPTSNTKPEMLGRVKNELSVPVMADESLMTLSDALYLAENNFVDLFNVKLMKVGGISEALHINSIAKAAGLEVMVGCMDESALCISAGLHFALARPNVLFADLDGHLDLLGDPTTGSVILKDGVLYPNDKPGLGVVFKI